MKTLKNQRVKALAIVCAGLLMGQASALGAAELPRDVVNSVMWESVAKNFLLSDKESSGKVVMDPSILVHTPKIAEDQLNIPVHVDARAIKNVKKIVLIADLNPLPKILTYMPDDAEAKLSVRIKVEQATPVRAAVLDTAGVWHIGATYVDAAGGGCSQPAMAHGKDDWVTTLAEVRAKIWRKSTSKTATMRLTVKHPMDTGLADGIPAFFIEELDFKTPDGAHLGRVFLHEPVSENPTLTLYPKLNGAANQVLVKGRDTEGNWIKVSIPAPLESSMLDWQ